MLAERMTVVGAGGVGGYFGALLVRGHAQVTLVARGAHGAAIAERGLQVRGAHGDFTVAPEVVTSAGAAPPADVALVAVKTYDLAAVLPEIQLAPGGVLVMMQNGIDADQQAVAFLGDARRVLGAVVQLGAEVSAPGMITHRSRGSLVLGAPRGGDPARAAGVAALLTQYGVDAAARADLERARWSKLLWNNAFGPISALTRRTVGDIVDDAGLAALVRRTMAEVHAVARAEAVALPADIIEKMLDFPAEVRDVRTSMLQDLQRGRPLERDALVTAVIRRARRHGVPTPINETIDALLAAVAPPMRTQ